MDEFGDDTDYACSIASVGALETCGRGIVGQSGVRPVIRIKIGE